MFVAVVGLGFVGLTLSLALVEKGIKVAGIEINQESYEKLSKGIPTINESGVERYLKKNIGKNFQVFSKLEDLEEKPEFYVLCVTTPIKNNLLDTDHLIKATKSIGKVMTGEEGYDMVTASRFLPESKVDVEDDKFRIRVFGNKLAAALVNLCWGTNITDTTNALRGFTKSYYKKAKLDTFGYTENFQLSIRCGKLKAKIAEVPTEELPRIGGVVRAKTIPVMIDMIKVFLNELKMGNNF